MIENLLYADNIEDYNDVLGNNILCFDTESCFNTEEIKKQFENKIYNTNEVVTRVYAWGISNTENDNVVYGNDLKSFFNFFNKVKHYEINKIKGKITLNKVKQIKQNLTFSIYVHNLGWDIEFLKYYLLNNGFSYYNSVVKYNKKIKTKYEPKSFHIVENDNVVYSANINLESTEVEYVSKNEVVKDNIFVKLNFIDSYKILPFSLDNIAKNVINIDEKYYKLSDEYDYDKVRPINHELTELEKKYLYNDVYILKEFIKQFYEPIGTSCQTASSISFDKFIQGKYGEKSYKKFLNDYPSLYEYKKIYNIIKDSYKGGWTQANRKYKHLHLKNINGTSIDINSSYPSVIKYKPLPYGIPTLYNGYKKANKNQLNLLTIGFNVFYNKNEDNLIGEIQVGAINKNVFGLNSTEYLASNLIDGVPKGTNGKSEDYRYVINIWEFELNNILENTVLEDYDVLNTLQFKSNIGNFGKIVDDYTLMKIEGKKEGNNIKQNFAKLILNSFYGKLASKPERLERKVVLNKNNIATSEQTDVEYLAEKKFYPAFSSCTTAWARVNLRTQLYKLGYNNILYFDTDSLYTLLPKEEVIKKLGNYRTVVDDVEILNDDNMLDKYELGKWDIEKTYTEFKTIGSKKYILKQKNNDIVCKCCGVPQDARETLTFETFKIGYEIKNKKAKKKVRGGYVILQTDYKLRDFTR